MKETCGDRIVGRRAKLSYLAENFFRGIRGYCCRIQSTYWQCDRPANGMDSPSRNYLNQWILKEFPSIMPKKEVAVLDIGCGTGYIRKLLSCAGFRGRYVGLDIQKHENFERGFVPDFASEHITLKIENYRTEETFDLICSITALEHIEDDFLAIAKCDKLLAASGIQIHIVPTFWALFLYLWHGYRQYNPWRVKHLFAKNPYKVYRLGGMFSFLLHFFSITIPFFFFKKELVRNLPIYSKLVLISNRLDRLLPICPSLYLIVIKKERSTLAVATPAGSA